MSRASRRARGRQIEAARVPSSDLPAMSGATRQIGALRLGLEENSIGVDVAKLEAPSQIYDADQAWIQHRPGRISLFFAKLGLPEPGHLESCLEVRYPPEDFVLTFWKASETFFERLKTYTDQWPEAARQVAAAPRTAHSARFHSEWASFTYASHSGSEAALDFYHLSTAAIVRFTHSRVTDGLRLRPVVRVQLTSFDLFGLIEQARPIVAEVLNYLPESHLKNFEKSGDQREHAD